MFKKKSDHNKIWATQKNWGHCPVATGPFGHILFMVDLVLLHRFLVQHN